MNDNDKDRFVDELLDASIRRYRSEIPRAGLENRILASARAADRATHRRGAWVWAFGAATGAVILLAVVTYLAHRKPVLGPAPAPQAAAKPAPPLIGRRAVSVPQRAIGRTRPTEPRQARPAQFPTPAPLSEEEKLFLAYVAQTPESGMEKPATRDSRIEPLEIPEIAIAKIEIKRLPRLIE